MHAEKYTTSQALDQDATVSSTQDNTVFLSPGLQLGEGPPSARVVLELLLASTVGPRTCLLAEEFEAGKDPLFCACSVEEGVHEGCLLV